ncbi:MAG: cysteine synthase family protein [Desulfobacteraceae bacterium]|jgi:cysteine synthase B
MTVGNIKPVTLEKRNCSATTHLLNHVGNTPMVELQKIKPNKGARILAKLEGSNPGGSVKDRPALWMIEQAEKEGLLTPGKIILEPTSGNTGIGLAMVGAFKGYRVKLALPGCVSTERRQTLLAYGAELVITPHNEKTDGAIREAHKIMEEYPDRYFMPNQFANPGNWRAHYETTAMEILEQTGGEISAFVAGLGTSGTLMGTSRRLKEHDPKINIVAAEPMPGHAIQGLKSLQEAIVPEIYDPKQIDHTLIVDDRPAFATTQRLAMEEGLFCGMSSGAAVWAAMQIAEDLAPSETVVTLLPDRGDRYLSTNLFRSICADCPP